ncbi:hypothetical protein C6A86_020705 [Mycobacterium sp. ITM-2016-00316]|uniref:hypothetical protein n=1 Tax=Mycobacterium sp. ITM-2016-00316 TaxID=2099695 RepID=UPI00287FBCCC|nr:hypothetical protein [Mycobacterium sp. ITM-2016-00316]WNG80616.1 hypothetical protein C6A86_020705 [Mycobacterium sp. ITM-2016-00316]
MGGLAAHRLSRHDVSVTDGLVLDGLAVDLWGGAWANNTRACARWYERPGQTNRDHLTFAAAHLHPLAYAWIDRHHRANPTVRAAAHYGYLLGATLVIRARPRHRRLLGVLTTVGGVALDRALGPSAPRRGSARCSTPSCSSDMRRRPGGRMRNSRQRRISAQSGDRRKLPCRTARLRPSWYL